MTTEETAELDKLYAAAKKIEYYENPNMKEKDIIVFLAQVFPETRCIAFPELLKYELLMFPVFSCVATWCNTQSGLCKEYTKEIILVSQALFKRFHPEKKI
jgi:hypothetical protein